MVGQSIFESDKSQKHYIPKFLLRQFTDERGMLWVYDNQRQQFYKSKPENAETSNDAYSINQENHLSKKESVYAELIKGLSAEEAGYLDLPQIACDWLADYFITSVFRSRKAHEMAKEFAVIANEGIRDEIMTNPIMENLTPLEHKAMYLTCEKIMEKTHLLRPIGRTSDHNTIYEEFRKAEWFSAKAPTGRSFILSDTPSPAMHGFDVSAMHNLVLITISHDTQLAGFIGYDSSLPNLHSSLITEFSSGSMDLANFAGYESAYQRVYSKSRSEIWNAVRFSKTQFRGDPVPWHTWSYKSVC